MKINTLIVDDEPLALEIMESHVAKLPFLELKGKCSNAFEAMEVIGSEDIELVFLDINMPGLNGLEMVKSLPNPPMIVFTTAHQEYAVQGFDANAIDYLLKPISFDRFLKAANKANEHFKNSKGQKHENHEADPDYIFVKADKKLQKVSYNDILFVEGLKDYVIIKTSTSRIITLQTMKSLEEKLPEPRFKRIHRSFIVQVSKIDAIVGNMVEIDKNLYPIGKNYKDELLELVDSKRL